MLQEVVHEQLVRRGAALDLDAQAHGQERLEFLADLLGLLQPRRSVRSDEVESLERLLVEVWRLRLDHLDGHDAQGPDVDLRAVLLLLDDFGRHPIWRSDHGGALRLGIRELSAEAEISWLGVSAIRFSFLGSHSCQALRLTNLNVPASIQKDVAGLDITMNNLLVVKVVQAAASLRIC